MLATKDEVVENESENVENQEELALSELNVPMWSVVSFEESLKNNLTYDEALELMKESKKKKISGLCIITDEAASRIA